MPLECDRVFFVLFVSTFDECPTDLVCFSRFKEVLKLGFTLHHPLFDVCTSNEVDICISEQLFKMKLLEGTFSTCAPVQFCYVIIGKDRVLLNVPVGLNSLISHPHTVKRFS